MDDRNFASLVQQADGMPPEVPWSKIKQAMDDIATGLIKRQDIQTERLKIAVYAVGANVIRVDFKAN